MVRLLMVWLSNLVPVSCALLVHLGGDQYRL